MTDLLRRPLAASGRVHDITPASADWSYVGFALHRLTRGAVVGGGAEGREAILVLVEGRAEMSVAGRSFGELGARMDVFERTPPACLYAPPGVEWHVAATTDCTLAVATAPGTGGYPAQVIGPAGIALAERGEGANTRHIHAIAMEERDVAESLLVTEVFTPAGNWSSYPPHRHDADAYPDITYLEETYYHRLKPAQGFAFQRIWTDDGAIDRTMTVHDHDVVLVPRGYHPCGAPHGYDLYYLNVMAGPRRAWRYRDHPDHAWIVAG